MRGSVKLSGNSSLTIDPGFYDKIDVSGNSSLTMNPGIYVIAGGGFRVSGNSRVVGSGVMIYNAGSKYPSATGGKFGSIDISGHAFVELSSPTTGTYAGILLFQSRDNSKTISFSGAATIDLNGAVYAPAALLSITDSVDMPATTYVVDELHISGNASVDSAVTTSAATPQGPMVLLPMTSSSESARVPVSTMALDSSSMRSLPNQSGDSSSKDTNTAKNVNASSSGVLSIEAATSEYDEWSPSLENAILTDVAFSLIEREADAKKHR